ncbi:MAG: hypothetical protein ACREQ7_08915 [Candidatus Binatia bacterium]
MNVDAYVIEARLRLNWTYSANLHRDSTIEGLAQDFLEAVQSLITRFEPLDAKELSATSALQACALSSDAASLKSAQLRPKQA